MSLRYTATATAQMCSSRAQARNEAKEALEDVARSAKVRRRGAIEYRYWTTNVGPVTYHYCTASCEVEE